jgi:aromatic ring-opening dioxygenase catalytic subunit (LigB family)
MSSKSLAQHYAISRALASLRDSGVAIVGSGMPIFYNLRLMFSGAANNSRVKRRNKEWSNRLIATVTKEDSIKRGKLLEG